MSGDLEKLKKALREEKYSETKSSSKGQEKKVNKPSEIPENSKVLIFFIIISSIFFAYLVFFVKS